MKTVYGCALLMMLAGSVAAAADETPPPEKAARNEIVPLEVHVVLTRQDGEKIVSRLPYTLGVNAGPHETTRLRLGVEVPVTVAGAGPDNSQAKVQYRNVGVNLDCTADPLPDGRYKLLITVEQSSVYMGADDKQAMAPGAYKQAMAPGASPMFRTFRTNHTPILRDGQKQQFTMATDPVTGEVTRLEVSLNVLK